MEPKNESCPGLDNKDKEVVPANVRPKRIVSLSKLQPTRPRTDEDIQRAIRQRRFAEMTPRQAGEK